MSDARLRELERRARATGAPEDRSALLAEHLRTATACERCNGAGRVRPVREGWLVFCRRCAGTGSEVRARVDLAGYCGDLMARSLLPQERIWAYHDSAVSLAAGLLRYAGVGPVPGWLWVQGCAAVAGAAFRGAKRGASGPGGQSMEACRQREQLRALLRGVNRVLVATQAWLDRPHDDEARHEVRDLMGEVVLEAGLPVYDIAEEHAWWRQLRNLLQLDDGLSPDACLQDATRSAVLVSSERSVRKALRDSLVSWALGGLGA